MIAKLRAFGMLEAILELPGPIRNQLYLPFSRRPQVFAVSGEVLDRSAAQQACFRLVKHLDKDTALYEFDGME